MSLSHSQAASLSLGGIGLNRPAARAYLVNVAETLQQVVLPALSGHAHKNANDCMETVLQLAAALSAPDALREPLAAIDPSADLRTQALAEGRAFEAADAAVSALIAGVRGAEAPLTRSVDAARIESYLRAQPQGGAALRVVKAVPLPGGRSKLTILVSVENAVSLPGELVFRQDWAAAVTGTSVAAMEFAILSRVHAAGILVPQPLLLEPGSEALGAPFIVVGRLSGRAIGTLFDPPGAQPVRDLAEQLGRIHGLPASEFANVPDLVERSHTAAQLREDLAKFRAGIEKLGSPLPALARFALDWLDATVEQVRSPRTLVHGDCGWHNNLTDHDRLMAVLDWEMAHLGSAALDLGWMKSATEKVVPWDEFMAIYQRAGGPQVDAFTIDWYSIYTKLWFMNLMLQARAAVSGGVLHDIDYTQVCAHYAPALMAHLSRAMQQALAHGR